MIRKRWIILACYVLHLILWNPDYNILSPNLTQVSDEFGIAEEERNVKLGGLISLTVYILAVSSSFLFGLLADLVHHRGSLFAAMILISKGSCFATYFSTYFAKSFEMLLFTITGVGIGGSLSIIFSILGDFFEAEGRNIASGKL